MPVDDPSDSDFELITYYRTVAIEDSVFENRVPAARGLSLMPFDSHNHLQSHRFGKPVAELVDNMKSEGITGCVVNATQEADWESVAGLAQRLPGLRIPCLWHPPMVCGNGGGGLGRPIARNAGSRSARHRGGNRIGRLGGLARDGSAAGSLRETGAYRDGHRPGDDSSLPQSLGRAIPVMDEVTEWPEKFLMHSFGGSIEIAERLLKKGAWFSFSGYFLQDRKQKVVEVFKKLPTDRILLETDSPEMMPPERFVKFPLESGANHPANLGEISAAFENMAAEGILLKIEENSRAFWTV